MCFAAELDFVCILAGKKVHFQYQPFFRYVQS